MVLDSSTTQNTWGVIEICPFALVSAPDPFWHIEGGALVTRNADQDRYLITGGSWQVQIINWHYVTGRANKDALPINVDMYLGFAREGSEYKESHSGTSNAPWSPWLAGEMISTWCNISKWRKTFTLAC